MGREGQKQHLRQRMLPALFVVALIVTAALIVNFASAEPVASNADVAAPANGTGESANLSIPAQQYIGFFGNVTLQVRKTGGSSGTSLYNRTALSGCVFINDGDMAAPAWPALQSPPDFNADGNYSLTGAYVTTNHFTTVFGKLCGVTNAFTLNTTDNYAVGIFRDGNGTGRQHFFGSNVASKSSTNGFGQMQYQIIAAKTATWGNAGYDFYIELG